MESVLYQTFLTKPEPTLLIKLNNPDECRSVIVKELYKPCNRLFGHGLKDVLSIVKKIKEKPKVNNKTFGNNLSLVMPGEFCKSANDLPTMYDINPGTIGKTQGERKLKIPAKKAIVRGIS